MEKQNIFLIIIIATIIFLYLTSIYETFISGPFDITSAITTDMDWKGSQLSKLSVYPNNLNSPSTQSEIQIKKLQSYQSGSDGETTTNYVSSQLKNNINGLNPKLPDSLEGFTSMNPFVSD